ncbi:MAG TPA: DNA topoisomerase IB [Solirubrobacteraceae bacterium]|jgi:DNA topoisomerase-1|nr:DNA topoisomerase IB [Solirubrobacteraceae bacterium]
MFVDADGARVADEETIDRVRGLAVPPAWEDVWICPDPLGHLQATGVDAAGRKQYIYHPHWQRRRAAEKFDAMLDFADALPALRRRVARDLGRGEPRAREFDRDLVLALALRLLDVGCMRIGGDDYAREHGSHGLTTLLKEHVRADGESVSFDFPGKSAQHIEITIRDPPAAQLVAALRRRRGASADQLLAYRDDSSASRPNGSRRRLWRPLCADEVNAAIKEAVGGRHSAKDFRTWNATVITAVGLAGPPAQTIASRKRAISEAIGVTAGILGNTPAVCRSAYVDPRLLDRYTTGRSIDIGNGPRDERFLTQWRRRARIERAVIDLLGGSAQAA